LQGKCFLIGKPYAVLFRNNCDDLTIRVL